TSECGLGPPVPACDAPPEAKSNGACVTLGGSVECNPVTNAGCAADQACQFDGRGGSVCSDTGTSGLCEPCGQLTGPTDFCEPDYVCVGTLCARFCCDDGDCGSGTCFKTQPIAPNIPVGFCITP